MYMYMYMFSCQNTIIEIAELFDNSTTLKSQRWIAIYAVSVKKIAPQKHH